MRTFYIFKLKKEFVSLYSCSPNSLYNVLRHLYFMKKNEYNYGYSLFNQLTEMINKEELDRNIFIKFHNKMIYSKNGNEHIINNLYKDEISIMTIKKAYILLNVNKNYSSFFNALSNISNEYFVCDFSYNDYFWINDIKILV